MIKKFIYILTIIFAVSIVNLTYQSIQNNDYYQLNALQDYIAINESKETIVLEMSFNEQNLNTHLNKIINYCQNKNITMAMITEQNDQGVKTSNYYIYSHITDLFQGLKIDKKLDIDFSNIDSINYYTTVSESHNDQGKLLTIQKDFFKDYSSQFNIYNMNNLDNIIQNNGYRIMSYFYLENKGNDYTNLVDMLQKENISASDITESYHPAQLEILNQEGINQMKSILILSTIIISLLMCLYFLKNKHNIMIKRLNGVSIFKILFKNIGLFFVFNISIFIISSTVLTFLLCGMIQYTNQDMYRQILISILGFLGVHFILLAFFYIFVYLTSHIKYLKKQFSIQHFMEISVLVKVLIIGFILPQFLSIGSTFIKSLDSYLSTKNNQELAENVAYFFYDSLSSEESDKVFNYYIQHEGIYADFHYYASNQEEYLKDLVPKEYWYQLDESIIEYPMIYANANYLKDKEIKDIDGNIIDLTKFKEDVLLVPKKHINEDLKKAMYSKQREIIYIQDSGNCFNIQLSDPISLSNPVIHLVTQKSTEVNLSQYLFLPINNKSISDYQKEIRELTTTQNDIDIQSNKITVLSQLKSFQTQLEQTIFTIMIYIIFMGTLIYQTIYLYIYENQLKISLSYMNGNSHKSRYQELYIYIPLTYLFIILAGIFILNLDIISMLIFCLISLFLEGLTHFILIHQFESKNIASILKGESEL